MTCTNHCFKGNRRYFLFNQKFNISMCQGLSVRFNMWLKNIADLTVLNILDTTYHSISPPKRVGRSLIQSLLQLKEWMQRLEMFINKDGCACAYYGSQFTQHSQLIINSLDPETVEM